MNITLIGGDERNIELANLFQGDGHSIKVCGFNKLNSNSIEKSIDLNSSISESKIVIGPIPCSKDNVLLNTKFNHEEIQLEDIFKLITKEQVFISGKITKEISNIAKPYNINIIDFLQREEMAILNAIPTAEGAIQIAMEEMATTIYGSNIMILGFGRIGKVLGNMLKGLGANIYIEARNYADLAWIKAHSYEPVHLDKILDYIESMDIIFNTIPSLIITEEILLKLKKECLIIDLASMPGGVDFQTSKKLGIKTIHALGLPGKVAPKTAAIIMKDTIYNIINDLGW